MNREYLNARVQKRRLPGYSRLLHSTALIRGCCLWLLLGSVVSRAANRPEADNEPQYTAAAAKSPAVRIAQLRSGAAVQRNYPSALPSLLEHIDQETSLHVVPEPVILESFEDGRLFEHPFVYANFADRDDWTLSKTEQQNLRSYLERGGFLYIDAGINAEFLREQTQFGQHHSFGEWDACPELKDTFANVFPERSFQPLRRSHHLFKAYYSGLPDTEILPDTVRSYVEQEKWPDGTYAAVGITLEGRLAVLVTPIIAMGWGRDSLGNWRTTIRFRIRESTEGLSDYLQTAAYSGQRFEVVREDGGKDIVYCQKQALPGWVQEPSGRWRVFRYYGSREISDFAHVFYTQLGTNIFVYALTH